jgi:hypothetical protein
MPAPPFAAFRYRKAEYEWVGPVPLPQFARMKPRGGKPAAGFAVAVPARAGSEPSAAQAKALAHLLENEAGVFKKVAAEAWDSFRYAYGQSHWRRMAGLRPAASAEELIDGRRVSVIGLTITREHKKGFAYLQFQLEADWEDDHGLYVVYAPAGKKADWCSADVLYDLTESDEDVGELEEESPWQQLVDAIYAGKKKTIDRLVAEGVDINAVPKGETPPLIDAVESMELKHVKLFLTYGADPNHYHPPERSTPYKLALKRLKETGLGPDDGGWQPSYVRAAMAAARQAAAGAFAKLERDWTEAIRLMEEAGGTKDAKKRKKK